MDLDDEFKKSMARNKEMRHKKISFKFKEILNDLSSENKRMKQFIKKRRCLTSKNKVKTKNPKKYNKTKEQIAVELERELWVKETLIHKQESIYQDITTKKIKMLDLEKENETLTNVLNSNKIINVQSKIHDKLKKTQIVEKKLKLDDNDINMKFAINMGKVDLKHARTKKNKKRKKVMELKEKIKSAENNLKFQKMEIEKVDNRAEEVKKQYEYIKQHSAEYEQYVKFSIFLDKNRWIIMDTMQFVEKMKIKLDSPIAKQINQSIARLPVIQRSTLNLFNMTNNNADYQTIESSTFEISNQLQSKRTNEEPKKSQFHKLPTIENSIMMDTEEKEETQKQAKPLLNKFKVSLSNVIMNNKNRVAQYMARAPQMSKIDLEGTVKDNNEREVFFYKKKLSIISKQHSKLLKFIKQHETMADSINIDIKKKQGELNHFKSELENLKEKGSNTVQRYELKSNIQLLKQTLTVLSSKNKKESVKEKDIFFLLFGSIFELDNTYSKFRNNFLKTMEIVMRCECFISNEIKIPSLKTVTKTLIKQTEKIRVKMERLLVNMSEKQQIMEGCLCDQYCSIIDKILSFKDESVLLSLFGNIHECLLLIYETKLTNIKETFQMVHNHLKLGIILKQKIKPPIIIKPSDRRKAIMVNNVFDMSKLRNEFSPSSRKSNAVKSRKVEFSKLVHNSPIYKSSKLLMERCLNLKSNLNKLNVKKSIGARSTKNLQKITNYKTQLDNIHSQCKLISQIYNFK